jgi:substrate import-associated zinc metallohydrolase lipoprotein
MKTVKIISAFVLATTIFVACSEKLDSTDVINIPPPITETGNATDLFIYNNLTKPYNIDVVYRWNYSQTDMSKELVPPREELVVPFLQAVIESWINPYKTIDNVSNGFFVFPRLVPKELLLLGSSGWNNDGTVTQGTAEGGKKIVLYEINNFDPANISILNRYFHVMHHEFGHIFHQTREFDPTFQNISVGKYTSSWYLNTDAYANANGFITSYAMSEYHEDFVETIAMMLTRSKVQWDAFLASMPESGKPQILQKVKYVEDYFNKRWQINIYQLQKTIYDDLTAYLNSLSVSPAPALHNNNEPYYSYSIDNNCQYCRRK